MTSPPDSSVTVVVLTHNRRAEALRTLDRLTALPEQPPVVVVDNASSDGTPDAVREGHRGVALIEAGANLGPAGRNLGLEHASTPYVAFCDDDSWWRPGALDRAVHALESHPRIGLVAGRVLVGPEEREDPCCADMAASPLPAPDGFPGPVLAGFMAGASVVRRAAFLEAGGFNGRMAVGGEEQLLAIDLLHRGWHLVYLEDAVAHHQPSPVRSPSRRQRALVRNDLWVAWLRRPLRRALRITACEIVRGLRSRDRAAGILSACRGAGWVAKSRRVAAPEVERSLRMLERQRVGL